MKLARGNRRAVHHRLHTRSKSLIIGWLGETDYIDRWRSVGSIQRQQPRDIAPHDATAQLGHHRDMARSSAQSDFVIQAEPEVLEQPVDLPVSARLVELPRAAVRSTEASAFATRWVMGLTFVMLVLLVILCAVGPHIPTGE